VMSFNHRMAVPKAQRGFGGGRMDWVHGHRPRRAAC
jgi:hypothetical protein